MNRTVKLLCFIMIVYVLFLVYIKILANHVPKIKKIQNLNEIELESGDLVLLSNYSSWFKGHTLCNNMIRLVANGGEWNHAAIVIKIDGEPYIYDTSPYYKEWIEYDFTQNSKKESGFIKFSKYVNEINGYLGVRKLKTKYVSDRSTFADIVHVHNKNMEFYGPIVNVLNLSKKHIKNVKYKYNCCQAVASIYNDAGIEYEHFHSDMLLGPLVDPQCPLFDEIVHIEPGEKLKKDIKKHFDKMKNVLK